MKPFKKEGILVEQSEYYEELIKAKESLVHKLKEDDISTEDKNRIQLRRSLIEPPKRDPNGYERLIGESNLLSVNFLSRGLNTAKPVCRIRTPSAGGSFMATGFLVGPRLLLTNHHVLGNIKEAEQAEAEFDFEHDADGVLKSPIQFNLEPSEIFYTNKDLDITFVSVVPFSDNEISLDRFGYLPLLPLSGKAIKGEWITIIQHPNGEPKQMTIRKSQIIEPENLKSKLFIHYTTDTEPGSSGSPVLNDQWQVLAIHHKAIPKSMEDIENKELKEIEWVANEGVRISAIFKALQKNRFSDNNASGVLERLSRGIGVTPHAVWGPIEGESILFERERKALKLDHWTGTALGYNKEFLTESLPLNGFLGSQNSSASNLIGQPNEHEIKYMHFSVVFNKDRKFPILTAVNIKGDELTHPGKRSDSWRRDIRIEQDIQPGDNFYVKSQGNDKVAFSRGHLVRRLDPCWGTLEEAKMAEMHTFHFTNAAPQVQGYNNVDWGDLEDYVLNQIQTKEKKVTVLTGPIFRDDDPLYGFDREGGPWQIPISYWKIAIVQKSANTISAAGFIVGQIEYVQALYESKVFSRLSPYTFEELQTRRIQTSIETIEELTNLDFSSIKPFDAHDALESTRQTRFIFQNSDILI